jgi:DNA-binding winged helix-turn-helix (wHTH) protein
LPQSGLVTLVRPSQHSEPKRAQLGVGLGHQHLEETFVLPGEDPATSALPEVAGWISIYEELGAVLRLVILRVDGSGQKDQLIRDLAWSEDRLSIWRDRHAELAGIVIDRKDLLLIYGGRSLRLTRREADLLAFLLRHPGRPFTSKQLAALAWQNSRLSDAQVRTYIMRLRGRLRDVGLGRAINVVRNRGYDMATSVQKDGTEPAAS